MKLNLFEAEDDYIRVGNIILPRDASQYGYDSYDSIAKKTQKRYDDEKEAERQEKERQEKERQRQEFFDAHKDELEEALEILDSNDDVKSKMKDLADEYCERGIKNTAETVGGEIVRALSILNAYKGNLFFSGEGIILCGDYADYLISNPVTEKTFKNPILRFYKENKKNEYCDYAYREFIDSLLKLGLDFLKEHIELFATPNEEDASETYHEYVDLWEEEQYCFDYEISEYDLNDSYMFERLNNHDLFDWQDFYYFCCDLTENEEFGGEVDRRHYDGDITITKLNRDDLSYWSDNFLGEFENWIRDIYDEHADELTDLKFTTKVPTANDPENTRDKRWEMTKEEIRMHVSDSSYGYEIPKLDERIYDVEIQDSEDEQFFKVMDDELVPRAENPEPTFRDLVDYLGLRHWIIEPEE